MSFSLLLYERRGRGRVIGQRACKVKGCQADVSSHLPSLFLHLVCFLHSPSLSLLIISPHLSLYHLFSFTLGFGGITDRSQLERGLKASTWIYQLLLNLLSDCQIPHHSCARARTHAHLHTAPGRLKQPLFSQKIDIKKEEEQKKYPSD